MNKKHLLILCLLLLMVMCLSGCEKNYEFTDSKVKLSNGDINSQTISYTYYDINKQEDVTDLYYYVNDLYLYSDAKLYIGMVDNTKKGKFTVCRVIYNPEDFSISGVESIKTYILNRNKTLAIKLKQGFSYYGGNEYLSYQEVIKLYDGYDIYYELVK